MKTMPKTVILTLTAAIAILLSGCGSTSLEKQETSRRRAIDHFGRGEKLENKREFLLALDEFLKAEEVSPRPAVYYHIGHCYFMLEQPDRAIPYLEKALAGAPDYKKAQVELAAARSKVMKVDTIALNREDAVTIDDTRYADQDVPTSETIALAEALPDTRPPLPQAEALPPGRPISTGRSAFLPMPTRDSLQKQPAPGEKPREMPPMEDVRKALFPSLYSEGNTQENEQRRADMERHIERKRMSMDAFSFHLDKAQHYRNHKMYDAAIKEYSDALKANPHSLDALSEMADLNRVMRAEDRAVRMFERAEPRFQDSARFYLKWGNLYLNMNQFDQAAEKYQTALARTPDYTSALNNLGIIEMKRKNYERAAQYFESVLELDPRYASARLNLGIVYNDYLKEPEKAKKHYELYLEIGGDRSDEVRQWLKAMTP